LLSKADTPSIQAFIDELPTHLSKNLKASIRANRARTGSNQGKRISVTLSIKAHMMLQDAAKSQSVTLSQVIENGLKESVKSNLKQENKRLKEKLSRLEQTELPE